MHEIRHYFPGIVKQKTAEIGGKEYYIDGKSQNKGNIS